MNTAYSAIPTPTPVCSQKDCSERVPVSCSATVDSKSMCVMIHNVADATKQENRNYNYLPGPALLAVLLFKKFCPLAVVFLV